MWKRTSLLSVEWQQHTLTNSSSSVTILELKQIVMICYRQKFKRCFNNNKIIIFPIIKETTIFLTKLRKTCVLSEKILSEALDGSIINQLWKKIRALSRPFGGYFANLLEINLKCLKKTLLVFYQFLCPSLIFVVLHFISDYYQENNWLISS